MVYNKFQIKEKITEMSNWTERNFVIFTLGTCFIGIIILIFVAFKEYQTAWMLMLPFSLLLYISILSLYTIVFIIYCSYYLIYKKIKKYAHNN
jgi:sterol desaturase/sphingolipid hydroxylase (fatty acid hydroxylase superfamily)